MASFTYVKNEMRGQRFLAPGAAVDAFRMNYFGDTSKRLTKVLRQLVKTHAKVYRS